MTLKMTDPILRYNNTNEGNLYRPQNIELPYSQGLDPLTGIFNTVDYLTTAPLRTGLNESLKASGPWNRFKAFGKGVVKSYANPNQTLTSEQVANKAGLSDRPLYEQSGRLSFGGLASKLSPAQIGGFLGETLLDPTNLVPGVAAGGMALGGLKKVGKELSEDLVEKGIKNNLGRPVHPTPEGQENFKKWFGESKVVDEKGQPIVAYHGTRANFDSFDPEIKPKTNQNYGKGTYFGSNPEHTLAFGKGANVMPAYLSLKNPLVITIDDFRSKYKSFDSEITTREIKKYGYDGVGIKIDNDSPVNEWVVFDPTQIKSATGNSGKFNPKDPNILKGLAPVGPWMLYQQNRQERTQNGK